MLLLHYDAVAKFNELFYKDLLTQAHLVDGMTLFKGLSDANGNTISGTLPGFPLTKDGIKYILPSKVPNQDGKGFREINLAEDLPILIQKKAKIFCGVTGYTHIKKCASAKFRPEKKMTFRELVDTMSDSLSHTNPTHDKLYWFLAITSMLDRINFRLSTPAGFGKDSKVDIMNNLMGNAQTVENPTIAKLEYLSFSKWLAVNEVVDIKGEEWRNLEQFLLAVGAMKNRVTKRSRAAAGVEEFLDVKNLSLSLFYNDIDHYKDDEKYFDFAVKEAIRDRFFPIRLYGRYTEKFNDVAKVDILTYVQDNMETYDGMIRTLIHYKHNIQSELHYYKPFCLDKLKGKERHLLSVTKLLNIIDLYCNTQEEFNQWCKVLMDANLDYYDMLNYPTLIEQYTTKFDSIKDIETELNNLNTFTEKNKLLNSYICGKKDDKTNKTFW
jgi:hypothetical protein